VVVGGIIEKLWVTVMMGECNIHGVKRDGCVCVLGRSIT